MTKTEEVILTQKCLEKASDQNLVETQLICFTFKRMSELMFFVTQFQNILWTGIDHTPETRQGKLACDVSHLHQFILIQACGKSSIFFSTTVLSVFCYQYKMCYALYQSREATMNAQIPANLVYLRHYLKPVTCLL